MRWQCQIPPLFHKGGAPGEDVPVTLPFSQLMLSISSRYHEGNASDPWLWIAPTIPVSLSSNDYFANRDPVLESIIKVINHNQNKLRFADHMGNIGKRCPVDRYPRPPTVQVHWFPMTLACNEPELQQLLRDVAFTREYGFTLHSIADGQCTIDVPFCAAFERPGGIVSGQVFMAAADVAMWLAIKTKLGVGDDSVTVEMKTSFLGSAREQGFRCTARVLKLGRQLIYGSAECLDNQGNLLTHHTLTYIRVHQPNAAKS